MKSLYKNLPLRVLSTLIIGIFTITIVAPPRHVYAGYTETPDGNEVLGLPAPGRRVLSSSPFHPAIMQGMTLHLDDPFLFDFIIHPGDDHLEGGQYKAESVKLIKYFMAALTVPEDEMWVNLSPYEKDRIIPKGFGETEMGRDLLAQDYMLKQLTASLVYPEEALGHDFWQRVYQRAYEKYGTTEIPLNTFNKVWIVPDRAVIYEEGTSAFILNCHLKVMLEEDYLALEANVGSTKHGLGDIPRDKLTQISEVSSAVIRQIIIPELEREVNEGKIFANLRQISNAVILATWYKQKVKGSLLQEMYVDKRKIRGVDIQDKEIIEKIYAQFIAAFKAGVFSLIKEEYDPGTRQVIPRKYFSGGAEADWRGKLEPSDGPGALSQSLAESRRVRMRLAGAGGRTDLPSLGDQGAVETIHLALADATGNDGLFMELSKDDIDQYVARLAPAESFAVIKKAEEIIINKGLKGVAPPALYLYIRLLQVLGAEAVRESRFLQPEDKIRLQEIRDEKGAPLGFSDVARVLLTSELNRSEDFRGLNMRKTVWAKGPKILLTSSYEGHEHKRGSFIAPPLGLHQLASFLRQFGFHVTCYDPNLYGTERLQQMVRENQYDIVGFSAYHSNLEANMQLVHGLKAMAPNSLFVLGNQEASFAPNLFLENGIGDIAVRGAGEYALLDIAAELSPHDKSLERYSDIPGLFLADGKFSGYMAPISQDEFRATMLSFDFQQVPYEAYWNLMASFYSEAELKAMDALRGINTIRIISESHCPVGCTFCSTTRFYDDMIGRRHPVRFLDAEDLARLMQRAVDAHPEVSTIYFHDDNFFINRKRIERLLGIIESRFIQYGIDYLAQGRSDSISEGLLQRCARAGFKKIFYGSEHFSQPVLVDMNKHISVSKNIWAILASIRAGIMPIVSILLWYPTVTEDDAEHTINVAAMLMEQGATLALNRYVWALPGASILEEEHSFKTAEFRIGPEKVVQLRTEVEIDSPSMRAIAASADEKASAVEEEIQKEYGVNKLPSAAANLAYFKTVLTEMGRPTDTVDRALDAILRPGQRKEIRQPEVHKGIRRFEPIAANDIIEASDEAFFRVRNADYFLGWGDALAEDMRTGDEVILDLSAGEEDVRAWEALASVEGFVKPFEIIRNKEGGLLLVKPKLEAERFMDIVYGQDPTQMTLQEKVSRVVTVVSNLAAVIKGMHQANYAQPVKTYKAGADALWHRRFVVRPDLSVAFIDANNVASYSRELMGHDIASLASVLIFGLIGYEVNLADFPGQYVQDLREMNPDLPSAFQNIIDKAREREYVSVDAFISDVQAAGKAPIPSREERLPKKKASLLSGDNDEFTMATAVQDPWIPGIRFLAMPIHPFDSRLKARIAMHMNSETFFDNDRRVYDIVLEGEREDTVIGTVVFHTQASDNWRIRGADIRMKQHLAEPPFSLISSDEMNAVEDVVKGLVARMEGQSLEEFFGIAQFAQPKVTERSALRFDPLAALEGDFSSMTGSGDLAAAGDKGGIDLNPSHMDIQTNTKDSVIVFPKHSDDDFEIFATDGLVPVIINISPVVNVPMLFGKKED